MRILKIGSLACCLLSLLLSSCQLDIQDVIIPHHEIPDTSAAPNLICNPSFERDGHGSLECWRIVKDFTTYPDTFVQIAPPGGGQFSLLGIHSSKLLSPISRERGSLRCRQK